MPGRYAKLKKDWLLRGWTDMPRVVLNWTSIDQRELSTRGLRVAEACDGKTDFTSIAFLPVHNVLLDKMIEEGIAEECEQGDSVDISQRYRIAGNPRLSGLHWSVTGLCNLNCRHCYMEAPSGRHGELSFEEVVHVIEQFEQANVPQVSLTGGEPFMRKDLLDIIEMLAQKKIWVNRICTNGVLITEENLEGIKTVGFAPSFQISFDGCGAHDRMRGAKGIEQKVIEAIRKVRAAGFPVVINTAVDRVSMVSLAATYDLLKGLGIEFWQVGPPKQMGNWRGTTTAISFAQQAKVFEPLLRRWVEDSKPFTIKLGAFFWGAGNEGLAQEEASGMRVTPETYACKACRETPYLLPDGTLLPCAEYTDSVLQERMPNILRESLPEVLNESFLRSILDMKKGDLLAANEECVTCGLFENCGVGCRASAVRETGNIIAKDFLACEIWKSGHKQRFRELVDHST